MVIGGKLALVYFLFFVSRFMHVYCAEIAIITMIHNEFNTEKFKENYYYVSLFIYCSSKSTKKGAVYCW